MNTELGYIFTTTSNFNIIPSIGLRYTHVNQDGWTESLHGGDRNIANWFAKEKYNYVDIPLDVRLSKSFVAGRMVITPEVHAGWTIAAKHEKPQITTGFVGTDRSFTVMGVNPGRNRFVAGANLKALFNERLEGSLDYNFEARNRYRDQTLSATLVVSF